MYIKMISWITTLITWLMADPKQCAASEEVDHTSTWRRPETPGNRMRVLAPAAATVATDDVSKVRGVTTTKASASVSRRAIRGGGGWVSEGVVKTTTTVVRPIKPDKVSRSVPDDPHPTTVSNADFVGPKVVPRNVRRSW